MPETGVPAASRPSLRTKSSNWRRTSTFGAMRYWMLGRSKLDTK
ncbi:MAG: hypothetical protein K0S05_1501 [Agromyces sp.]|nr:hypothetical protein [Agromyces sp.]